MSDGNQWMPLYVGDYLADTMHLTGAEHGAYLLLLMHSWRTGPLPDDDRRLAGIARTDAKAWAAMREHILSFFTRTDEGFVQGRLEKIRAEQGAKTDQRRAAGRASAMARKAKRAGNESGGSGNGGGNESSTETERASNERSTSVEISLGVSLAPRTREPEPEEENPPSLRSGHPLSPKPEPRGSRLPAEWQPAQAECDFALSLGLDPARIALSFRDYWHGKPGAAGRKSDWPATWRNWCRREAEQRQNRALPRDDASARRVAAFEAAMDDAGIKPADLGFLQ
jgi:uncharacterized protein YdaU (DUF1376 family)